MDWPALRDEILSTTDRVCELLRTLPDGGLRVPRVTWTAAEVGAHLVSLPRRYGRMIGEPQPLPASLAADNARELELVPERDPATLADLLRTEVTTFLDALGPDGDRPVSYFTVPHSAAGLGGILLTELLVHGGDLAAARGASWSITPAQSVAALRGILPAIGVTVVPDAAAHATGTYHIHLRGGDDWTLRVHERTVSVERARPARADLHLSADPVVFLRNAYGQVSSARAAFTGGIVMWGRRPWLAPRFARMFAES